MKFEILMKTLYFNLGGPTQYSERIGICPYLLDLGGRGAPCFKIGVAEDNFIFYIGYCFFFVPVIKLRWEYNILKQFESVSYVMFDYGYISPPSKLCDSVKNLIFVTKKADSTLIHDFSPSQPS